MRQKYYRLKQRENVDCKQFDETVEQIISACAVLAKEHYIQRHDTVCAELRCNMCKEIGEHCTAKCCMAVYRNWYKQVLSVRLPYCGTNSASRQKYPNIRTGITVHDNKQGTCMSIDVAIPADRNVAKIQAEKILKYKFHTI